MKPFFSVTEALQYEGENTKNDLAFRHYDAKKVVLGKTMRDKLRFAVCYWHNFVGNGTDPFGGPTFQRPWFVGDEALQMAKTKADYAFEMFRILGFPYFCFHDADVIDLGDSIIDATSRLASIEPILAEKMESTGVKLLWGTANLFSHRRYMGGAATNPDPAIYTFAAAQVKNCLETTHRLGGENYVLWGGREGYDTLLNTNIRQEMEQLGRFLTMVVEHKHKIGFKGTILLEPKPQEPTKHQYDHDTATVYGFLKKFDLEKEVKVNIEANHATLSGHSFEHEIATALALDIFGSLDVNRGDAQCGWDTDQFPNNLADLVVPFFHIFRNGGFTTGGLNFDAKLRRQSIDPDDLLYAHIGGADICARALLAAEAIIEDGKLESMLAERYSGWKKEENISILQGKSSLEALFRKATDSNLNPEPKSGRQEYLENIINRYI